MRDTSDALGGILDAVVASFAQVRSQLGAVDTNCKAEITSSTSRAQSHSSAITGLAASRLQHLATASGAQAELDHLASQEAKTQSSYDSAVSRRAVEAQAFTDWQTASVKQRDVLSRVLDHLQKQRQVALAVGTGGSSGNVTAPSASQSSQLDYVIGTFSNLLGTVTKTETQEVSEHAQQDAQLLSLVGAYMDSLHRIDAQYEAKNTQKSTAQAAAANAAAEARVRERMVDVLGSSAASLRTLCGAAGSGGEVERVVATGEQAVNSLKLQVEQTLLTMEELIKWASTTTTAPAQNLGAFLQVGAGQRPLSPPPAAMPMSPVQVAAEVIRPPPAPQALPPMSPVQVAAEVGMPARAARWAAEARASGLTPLPPARLPQPAEDSHAAALEAAAASLQDRRLAEVLRSVPLAALLRTQRAAGGNSTGALSAASQECVQQKQQLTASLLASRQAERQSRRLATDAQAQVAAMASESEEMRKEETYLAGAQALLDNVFVQPKHLQLGGSLTYDSAASACSAQGGRLCFSREVCPHGDVVRGPMGAALAGQHWAPVDDMYGEWVHIGSSGYGTCALSAPLQSPPDWMSTGAADAAKDHIFCCGVGPPLASISGSSGFVGVLTDAAKELETAKANVTAILSFLGSPPVASGLPGALVSIGASLSAMQSQWPQEAQSLVGRYTALQSQYVEAAGNLQMNISILGDMQNAVNGSWTLALADVQREEGVQQGLLAQQAALQARCEAVLNATAPTPAPAGSGGA